MSAAAVAVSPAARRLADRPAVAGANGEESFGISKANGSKQIVTQVDDAQAPLAAGRIVGTAPPDVRFTSKADIGTQPRDVRFVPKADILHCGKERRCSITSSARSSPVLAQCCPDISICHAKLSTGHFRNGARMITLGEYSFS